MMSGAGDIARRLAERAAQLAADLLPAGYREGPEWRAGSIAGEPGGSLGVHLTGAKAGIWADFATGQKGDALDLVHAVLGLDMHDTMVWSRRWLGLEDGQAAVPARPAPTTPTAKPPDSDRWRYPWRVAKPVGGTRASLYLAGRGLRFHDPDGEVLRFADRRARKSPDGRLETHPAMLALLRDVCTGEPCGIVNVYLQPDGRDRLRDRKGKTVSGRSGAAAVMLSDFADTTMGLVICEGVETGISLLMDDLAPVWALGGAGNLAAFPVLGGVEALTIAADAGQPGQEATEKVTRRWSSAGREVAIITPKNDDWAAPRAAS
jgi:Toprim domain